METEETGIALSKMCLVGVRYVQCIKADGWGFTNGNIYEVTLSGSEYTTIDDEGNKRLVRNVNLSRFVVFDPSEPQSNSTKSDGGSSSYYELPDEATELRHLIAAKEMSFARGNMFKALYRLGEKDGTSVDYDLNKLQFFIDDLKEMRKKGYRL